MVSKCCSPPSLVSLVLVPCCKQKEVHLSPSPAVLLQRAAEQMQPPVTGRISVSCAMVSHSGRFALFLTWLVRGACGVRTSMQAQGQIIPTLTCISVTSCFLADSFVIAIRKLLASCAPAQPWASEISKVSYLTGCSLSRFFPLLQVPPAAGEWPDCGVHSGSVL